MTRRSTSPRRRATRPASLPGLVPGTAADILLSGLPAGFLGRVQEDDPEYPLFVAELATGSLAEARAARSAARERDPLTIEVLSVPGSGVVESGGRPVGRAHHATGS